MPFRPFHFGVGVLAKAAWPKRFSFQVFVVSQILMDIEPGIRLWRGDAILHGASPHLGRCGADRPRHLPCVVAMGTVWSSQIRARSAAARDADCSLLRHTHPCRP